MTTTTHPGYTALLALVQGNESRCKDLTNYEALKFAENPGDYNTFVAFITNYSVEVFTPTRPYAPDSLAVYLKMYSDWTLVAWSEDYLRAVTLDEAYSLLTGGNLESRIDDVQLQSVNVTLRVPSFDELFMSLPWRLRRLMRETNEPDDWGGKPTSLAQQLENIYNNEIRSLVREARRCPEAARITMSLFSRNGRQWVASLACCDLSKPVTDSFNMHLQNTSQWVHAGAIVVDDQIGEVSSHH